MKTFLSDSNGVTVGDFEKFLTGLIFFLASLAVIYKYLTKDFTDYNFVGFTLGIGALFITRKIASYLKPERYIEQNTNQTQSLSPVYDDSEQEGSGQNQTLSPKSSY